VPRSSISFSFEDSFEDLERGTTFIGLSEITGCTETFFLEVGTEVGGAGTEAGVTEAIEFAGTVGIFGKRQQGQD
jgi:hypothetical protein